MIEITPLKKPFDKTLSAPPSKSYTNRALLIGALSEGKSQITNTLQSDDTKYMEEALKQLGVDIEKKGNSYTIKGKGGKFKLPEKEIFIGNAGTAMRFLTTACALTEGGKTTIGGNKRMNERPIQDLLLALKPLGVNAKSIKDNGCPPLLIEGGGIKGGVTNMMGDKSSQYFTSILLSAPYAKKDVTINTIGELTSKSYIDMTIDSMREFGVDVENKNYSQFIVKAGKGYSAHNYAVEGDFSGASYLFAAAAITGSRIKVTGINPNSAQGDRDFVNALEKMGCLKTEGHDWIEITGRKLKAIPLIDMNHMPDVAMSLAIVAAFAEGKTKIINVSNLRIKESDRINATVTELKKTGITAEELADGMIITGGKSHGSVIDTYDDHRIAMCFGILGLKTKGMIIKNEGCVSKTYPSFFEVLKYMAGE
ncbi:MAG: 3-phosphoshikimate 1-carboxyvinyltransferase [Candidatus Aenigmarchaeota archaeon]|nr:3-phosphoshikimate 1-carboxyvinyltransferase [Candidatus Aenigmarchaeota archaeon]